MRSKFPFLVLLAAVLILIGPGAARADNAVQARILLDNGNRVVIDYDLGDYQSRSVEIAGVDHQEIWFPSEPVVLEAGAPALPHVNRSIVIPDDARMSLRVLAADFHEVFAKIAPSKGNSTLR